MNMDDSVERPAEWQSRCSEDLRHRVEYRARRFFEEQIEVGGDHADSVRIRVKAQQVMMEAGRLWIAFCKLLRCPLMYMYVLLVLEATEIPILLLANSDLFPGALANCFG